ncbi:MAG: hybrid sensor histidine kinase/response regulator [Chloroflexi bacterium]|nr:MAG: hybrid sensor histidine kinase/response regulator [Chloroflexota bacterium]
MDDADLLNIFWEEANEHLATLNTSLLQVEMLSDQDEAYFATIKEMNRVAHSLKGAARAVGIHLIETVAHYMEEVFHAVMNRKLSLSATLADAIYDGLDLIQQLVEQQTPDDSVVVPVLSALEQIVAQASVVKTQEFERVEMAEIHTPALRQGEETVRVTVTKLDRLMGEISELFVARMHSDEQQNHIKVLLRTLGKWQREWRNARTAYIRLVRRLQEEGQQVSPELPVIFRFLEYNQRSITEVNRMVVGLSQAVAQNNMRLTALTDQLQDEIGGMRLVPFESIVGGFQRMVRDLGRDTQKQIYLEVRGASVEIDKAVLDTLKDPIMHLLRNAIDHGIESPSYRTEMGKPAAGRIVIDVQQRGSEIVIVIADDGRGIDADEVRRSIVQNRLMSESEAAILSDDEARMYVFYAGLSTSKRVTTISGRGLGMDIVRDRVESLRGRVNIQSEAGQGTSVTISVPVSLTRMRCVVLQVGGQLFAIPSATVIRMESLPIEAVFTAEGREMIMVNERPVMLVSLAAVLNLPMGRNADQLQAIVLQATDRQVAFEVDELMSEVELVLKPLGVELQRAQFVSGAALMGSGDVLIVLDVNDLVRQAVGVPIQRQSVDMSSSADTRRVRVLVVDDSITTRTLEKNILETAGFEVYTAIDGVEALHMLSQHSFDVVVTDIEMPRMDGLELCIRVKSTPQFEHIPVILLTSLTKPEQREAGLKAGADAYLVKSQFDQAELLETIRAVV